MLSVVVLTQPDLVVVGPEVPLAHGIVDALKAQGVKTFGPTRAAALLETSKAFAKDFMHRWHIPTAIYEVCHTIDEVRRALMLFHGQVVVKVDGLAAGKGVILCDSHEQALTVARDFLTGVLTGSKVDKLILEEMLSGPEVSYFAICDGHKAIKFGVAQDHKRLGEGDTGPNTGGMGAYSTDDLISEEMSQWILEHVAARVVTGMQAEGRALTGVLFIGLMLTSEGPKVLEFNTRFGDPETEAMLLRIETDLVTLLETASEGRVESVDIQTRPGASACVVLASAGYPGVYGTGRVIVGLDNVPDDVMVFHAGTRFEGGEIVTAGGRVLAVTASGEDLNDALRQCYDAIKMISFEGMQFRNDIGWRALSSD